MRVFAIDPGSDKCGLAVVDRNGTIVARGVVPTTVIDKIARDWTRTHRPAVLVVGSGTAGRKVRAALQEIGVPLESFPESNTTLRARDRYFADHPPRGWRRLIPRGLQSPPIPVDDYAAVLIAEDYLALLAQG